MPSAPPVAVDHDRVCRSQSACRLATQSFTSLSQLPGVDVEGTSLLVEFAGFLRRPMLQQAPVRKALYEGLHALAADKECALCIFNILSPSLQKHVTVKARFVLRSDPCCAVPGSEAMPTTHQARDFCS